MCKSCICRAAWQAGNSWAGTDSVVQRWNFFSLRETTFFFSPEAIQLMDEAHPHSNIISYLSSLIVDANHYIMPSQGDLDSRLTEQLCAIVYLN